jgi:hypothetical protein
MDLPNRRDALKTHQPKHWTQTKFDRSVILPDQIVEGVSRSHFGPLVALMAQDLPRRPM